MLDRFRTWRRLLVSATFVLLAALAWPTIASAQQVVVIVNGEPITALDIEQRSKLTQLSTHKAPSRQEIIDELIQMMRKNPERIEAGLSLFSATRHLERIADHATNIAEDVIYLVEGEIIRHHPEAIELP